MWVIGWTSAAVPHAAQGSNYVAAIGRQILWMHIYGVAFHLRRVRGRRYIGAGRPESCPEGVGYQIVMPDSRQ